MRLKDTFLILIFTFGLACFYSCNSRPSVSIRVMSYNIHHGEGMDGKLDLSRIAGIIKSQSPDLCSLQEIDNFCSRSDKIGQTDVLAKETSMQGTFGRFMDFQSGEYGMCTLTTYPIHSAKVLQLPDGKYEPRSSIVQEVELSDENILIFANVHFDWIDDAEGSSNRLNQAKALMTYINDLGRACIIAGDFNCTPDSPTMQYFKKQGFSFVDKGGDNLSFQGDNKVEIDHVIFRNDEKLKFKPKSVMLLDEPVSSDHRPLVVEFEVIVIQ